MIGQKEASYKTLRDFVKNIANRNATDLDVEVGEAIHKSRQTMQNIVSGKRVFSWEEAIAAADILVNLAIDKLGQEDQISFVALEVLTRNFLTSYGPSVNGEVLQKSIDEALSKWFDMHKEEGFESKLAVARYHNLPEFLFSGTVIRKKL